MSKKPITYVHYFAHDHTAMIGRELISDSRPIRHTYRNVTPASASRLREALREAILEGNCDVFLPTGYSPTAKTDPFYTDWMVFTPEWDPTIPPFREEA